MKRNGRHRLYLPFTTTCSFNRFCLSGRGPRGDQDNKSSRFSPRLNQHAKGTAEMLGMSEGLKLPHLILRP
jgi:hypothetical protein